MSKYVNCYANFIYEYNITLGVLYQQSYIASICLWPLLDIIHHYYIDIGISSATMLQVFHHLRTVMKIDKDVRFSNKIV